MFAKYVGVFERYVHCELTLNASDICSDCMPCCIDVGFGPLAYIADIYIYIYIYIYSIV